MLTSAVFAGVSAGLFSAVLHFVFIEKSILLAEEYEDGKLIHFASAPDVMSHGGQAIDLMTGHQRADASADASGYGGAAEDHDHAATHAEPQRDALTRNGLTVMFMALVYSGYGMLLVAGFAIAGQFGKSVTAREGLLWGIAGFAAFQLMPAMGLSPELPGIAAADLSARQIWWAGTALSTAGALAIIAYTRGIAMYLVAGLLLALPHLIGAPELDGYSGSVPPELAAGFAARALGVGLATWALLGALAGQFWNTDAA